MSFSTWNNHLIRYFFGNDASKESVRLTVTNELLESEFEELGGVAGFKQALIAGPEWFDKIDIGLGDNRPNSFFMTCDKLFKQWKSQRRPEDYQTIYDDYDAPPYFIYLCALCLAWTQDAGDHRDTNFYDRLELIYPNHSLRQQSTSLGRLGHLWDGLEQWTNKHEGSLGWFNVERLGNHAHVGLPKSQVILTSGNVDRTPDLFYNLALSIEDELSVDQLSRKILGAYDKDDFLLGRSIYQHIEKNSTLGRSALGQLLEHFEEWDGRPPIRSHTTWSMTNGERPVIDSAIVAGLEYIETPAGWNHVRIPVMPQTPDGDLFLEKNGRTYTSHLRGGTGTRFVDNSDQSNVLRIVDIEDDRFLKLVWKNQYEGERTYIVAVAEPKPTIACFNWSTDRTTLLQRISLPSEGSCYCLVQDKVAEHFHRWCDKAEVDTTNSCIAQLGLGDSAALFYVTKIGNAPSERWAMFPDGGDNKRRRPRRMTLIGGSRQRRERARKTYLPFDPPVLKLEAEDVCIEDLECKNCTLTEITPELLSVFEWTKPSSRLFEIIPTQAATRVSITLVRNDRPIGKPITFRLLDREDFESTSVENYKTNALGIKEKDDSLEGVCGAIAPFQKDFEYDHGKFNTWSQHQPKDSDSSVLLDWIATQTSVRYSTLRNFVGRRLTSELSKTDLTSEVMALSNLGHIEIQTDNRGRWSHIHGAPVVLYPIPSIENGVHQYVLTGAYTASLAQQLEEECIKQSLQFDRHPQLSGRRRSHWLIPSRVSVISSAHSVINLGRKLSIKVLEQPPAWSLATWCSGYLQWYDQLVWHNGTLMHAEASYRPLQYRTMSPKIWPEGDHVNYNLVRSLDSQTKKHFNYSLVKKEEEEFFHAICGHKAWGTWFTQKHFLTGFFPDLVAEGIPMPYDSAEKTLYLPYELDPPPLISKALTLCSGLAGTYLAADECTDHLTEEFALEFYTGFSVSYRSVPKIIADILLDKLGAVSKILTDRN
jgi:hypothetical protein